MMIICCKLGLNSVDQIGRVFGDNFAYFSVKKPMLFVCVSYEAILINTHNIRFYGELTKIILQLSSNIVLICSSGTLSEKLSNLCI